MGPVSLQNAGRFIDTSLFRFWVDKTQVIFILACLMIRYFFYVSMHHVNQYCLINCTPYFPSKIYSVNGLIMILYYKEPLTVIYRILAPPGLLPTTLHRQLQVECLVRLHSFCLSSIDIDVVCIQVVF